MVQINFKTSHATIIPAQATVGESLMEAAVAHDVPGIDADCGGGCACATCHILLPDDMDAMIPPAEEDEQYLLDFLDNRQKGSRLSCQITVHADFDGMTVTVPTDS